MKIRIPHRHKSLIGLCLISSTAFAANPIPFPDQYRDWTHVKTVTLHKNHPLATPFAGIHHIYANRQAMRDIDKNGGTSSFNDGSTLIFDLRESVHDQHASAEGKRILLGLMTKDNNRFGATGGWGFEAWAFGDNPAAEDPKRLVHDNGQACFACHESQQANDYIFSRWRD